MRSVFRQFDMTVTGWVKHIPPSWDGFFLVVTKLGEPVTVIALAVLLSLWAWSRGSVRFFLGALLIPVTLIIGSIIKLIIQRQRPVGDFQHILRLDTFSFPSGHASGSTIAYGLLAYIAWHVLPSPFNYIAVILAAILIILIGLSRVYLGVHYPTDVIAGWLLGLIVLVIAITVVRPFA